MNQLFGLQHRSRTDPMITEVKHVHMSVPDGIFQLPCRSRRMGRLNVEVLDTTLESFSNSASRLNT